MSISSSGNVDIVGTTTSSNFIVDGTGYAIKMYFNGTATLNNNSNAVIFTGAGASGDYPAGTLNLQSRGDGVARDINLITGATPSNTLTAHGNGNISFYEDTGTTPKMFWDASNEVVRIGNTSDTYSPTYTEHMVIGNYNADEDHGITFLSDLDNTFTLGFADDGHSTLRGAIKYSHLNDFMTFHAFADAECMRITKTGDVGIGTASPSAKLHVDTSNSAVAPNAEADDFFVESSSHTGITIGSGISSRSSIYFANSTDNDIAKIVVAHDEGSMKFTNNTAERMRIDSSGSVGIGNTTMSSFNSEANNLVVGTGSGDEGITIYTGSSAGHHGSIFFADGTDVNAQKRGQIRYEHNNEVMSFFTNTSERLRIASNGRQTYNSSSTASGHGNFVGEVGASYNALAFEHTNGGGIIGTVRTTASSTAYNTSSDYRLKENVNYDFDATSRLKQLKPARFNFIADEDTTVDGFLAHEVSSIVPEAISGEKDAVNEDGSINPQGIDQSKLVPLLVKTIQELEARITQLENA
jgi:hypothetical protein